MTLSICTGLGNGLSTLTLELKFVVEKLKVRIVIRVSCKVVYHLAIATVAYFTTRDQGESDLLNMKSHVSPSLYYKLVLAFKVFSFLSM